MPKVAALLEDAEPDILAFYAFPAEHWRKLRSTNPLERFNNEIGRRTDVVGIFPDDASLIRLVGMLCIEQNDEWLVGRGYLSAESISLVLQSETTISLNKKQGGGRTPSGLSRQPHHRRTEHRLLHHVPGLDSSTGGATFGRGSSAGRGRTSRQARPAGLCQHLSSVGSILAKAHGRPKPASMVTDFMVTECGPGQPP